MDNIVAIGAGLGLRALIDAVAHETMQANALVGLWEGVVLNHFLGKSPSSIDPYIGLGLRLFIDFLFTTSVTRLLIVLLWTGLGMLLADVAVQLSSDRRFRRLWRRSTRSRSTIALGPGQSLRPTTTPVPGQFDQWSVTSGPVSTSYAQGLGLSASTSDSRSTSQVSRTPTETDNYSLPPRPRTPSDLEYLTLPVIPDSTDPSPSAPVAGPSTTRTKVGVDVDIRPQDTTPRNSRVVKSDKPKKGKGAATYNADDKPAINSGLTTPTSNPRSLLDEEDRPRVHSGLTTPEHLHAPLTMPEPEKAPPPPSKIPIKQPPAPSAAPARLTIAAPSPTVSMPQPQLTPVAIPPVSDIPNIPTPDDKVENRTPPPPFEEAIKAPSIADDVSSIGESVITGKKNNIIAKADELRKLAKDAEAERDRLRNELRKAEREKRPLDIICLQVELQEAQENIDNLHAKAARRYYKAHNLNPAPQEIDVHRLNSEEAFAQVKKAIRDARGFGATQLRIIVGKGNHSKGNVPVLKPAITSELQKLYIPVEPDPKNSGVLIVKLPAGKFSSGAPVVS
ncbi:hypothetical protein BDY19DRAFT_968075 [Irpex rosettiformis]|uniref:Uncharacterized protein n=1 Tax=Irpex rosettiformis TaxID=378272 RepID=A0ACB8TST5_9APHY|nr:hypothetical protein BDY19DRAFT_968075 [Irpex rosettiformis]